MLWSSNKGRYNNSGCLIIPYEACFDRRTSVVNYQPSHVVVHLLLFFGSVILWEILHAPSPLHHLATAPHPTTLHRTTLHRTTHHHTKPTHPTAHHTTAPH